MFSRLIAPHFAASPDRLKQAREQLGLPSAFQMVDATAVLELFTNFGVVQVPLPAGEFLVSMIDPIGARRFGMVRFEGLEDTEGWQQD